MTRIGLCLFWIAASLGSTNTFVVADDGAAKRRPNILLAISDDQSYPHASAYGTKGIKTPAFDRVAAAGVLFRNGFAASPGCSPARAALLTGRHTWQLEQAGTHASSFPNKYAVYPDLFVEAGYHVGYTGKAWGPGNFREGGWEQNPAGKAWQSRKMNSPPSISNNDYAANFADFLEAKPEGQPFCFWFGASEPHRAYKKGIGLESGKTLADADVPPFLPDTPEIRSDILDYYFEIEWFDQHLTRILDLLAERGELDNTLVLVTSDNGMPFPRAKANLYEYGFHVPLAVSWPAKVPAGRTVDDLVGFVDFAPTFLEAAGVAVPAEMTGRSFVNVLTSEKSGLVDATRIRMLAGRERHSSSRYENWTYPIRALRTPEYLYIRNFRHDRWPAGDPVDAQGRDGYYDIDAAPSKTFLVEHRDSPEFKRYFDWAVGKRPADELYDVQNDPGNLHNLADDPQHADTLRQLRSELENTLRTTGDPRVLDGGDVYETYKRYSPIREFPAPSDS
jgi:N-sulfoglucosamine sulfohydrolase